MTKFEFRLPDIGEGLADAEIVRWLVGIGDTVVEDQPVADVETDKAVVTMPAPATGIVTGFGAAVGERVEVGAVLLVMDIDEAARPAPVAAPTSEARETQALGRLSEQPAEPAAKVRAAPAVRKLAAELGVALETVDGTGPGGRITDDDVRRYAVRTVPKEPATQVREAEVERVPVRGLRRRIAEAMTQAARAIPHVCGFHELDATALVGMHARLKRKAEARGVRLTYLPLLVRASVLALKAHPSLNASFDESEPAIVLKKFYNIGIATGTPEGLLVPVIHAADRLSVLDIAREVERLVALANARQLSPRDLQHGTFTITNVGPAGGWFGTSIIRAPEAAILGVGRIEERPVVRQGQVVARFVLPLSLTFDHRVMDGDAALAFVGSLREAIETPELLLFGEPPW